MSAMSPEPTMPRPSRWAISGALAATLVMLIVLGLVLLRPGRSLPNWIFLVVGALILLQAIGETVGHLWLRRSLNGIRHYAGLMTTSFLLIGGGLILLGKSSPPRGASWTVLAGLALYNVAAALEWWNDRVEARST